MRERIRTFESITARVKSGLAALLMCEAWALAHESETIESEEKNLDWPQPRHQENLGHAAASVILATASLEAAINEIYLRAVDRNASAFPSLTERQVVLLAQLWEALENSRASIVKKHQVALVVAGGPELSSGEEPTQSAAALVSLRDHLVHFKPEWGDELDKHEKLELRLRSKFAPNQLSARATGHMLWFPGQCLGAGCATWACETAVTFHSEFATRLGIQSHLPAKRTVP